MFRKILVCLVALVASIGVGASEPVAATLGPCCQSNGLYLQIAGTTHYRGYYATWTTGATYNWGRVWVRCSSGEGRYGNQVTQGGWQSSAQCPSPYYIIQYANYTG